MTLSWFVFCFPFVGRTGDAHKQAIEKSKFLGGDVEHTHLVKGLDFALLQKVRSEIERKAGEQGDAKGADAAQGQEGPSSVSAAGAKGRRYRVVVLLVR